MRKLFGDKSILAIDFLGVNDAMVQADIYVCGLNITPEDNQQYDQYFVHGALGSTAERLAKLLIGRQDNATYFERELDDVFGRYWYEGTWDDYEVFNWQPCTGGFVCAIVPTRKGFFICVGRHNLTTPLNTSEIDPGMVIATLTEARKHAVEYSSNPYLKLKVE